MSSDPFQLLTKVIESPQMNFFFRLLSGLMVAGIVTLGRFSVALANGGDVHFDDVATGIPAVVLWIGGGVLVGLLLFIFITRVFFKQTGRPSRDDKREKNPRAAEEKKR